LTNCIGELEQHDSSHHLWAPLAETKWYLITTLDDHSRRILYGELLEKETSWAHIEATKAVVMRFGCPFRYYPDCHSIFKYIERRDSLYRKFDKTQENAFVQWKEVLKDLNIQVVNALSPQAKGKVERSYQWLQDHIVRTCSRENITKIADAREVLYQELYRYNHKQIHSTTQEIPVLRFEKAVSEGRSFFKTLQIVAPFETLDDIFCYRYQRIVDAYRRVSWENLQFAVHTDPRTAVELRVSFDIKKKLVKVRIWTKYKLVGEQIVKADELKKVHF
jgi:hypothetical protein